MRLLLDTHLLIAVANGEKIVPLIREALDSPESAILISVASFWEIAIKYRLKKLKVDHPPVRLPDFFLELGYMLLSIDADHAVEELQVNPPTRDPFDRMLLAQCQIEGLRLVTTDRALIDHPLAWRAP